MKYWKSKAVEALLLSVTKRRTGKLGSEILHNFFIAKIVDDSARSGAGAAILRSWSRRRVKMNGSTALSFLCVFQININYFVTMQME